MHLGITSHMATHFSPQSTASSGLQSTWNGDILKKIKTRRQQVFDNIKDRDQFKNIAMEYTLENTRFQRVCRVLFEDQNITLFNQSFLNFWELGLHVQKISNYKFEDWSTKLPKFLDDLEELSNFPLLTERALIGEKPLKVALPFVPKFINYKELGRLYMLDNTEAWFTGESLVLNKIPMTDVFTFKQCFIVKALSDTKVQIQFRWFVDFHKWTPFKGTVMSSTQEEIAIFSTKFFKPALDEAVATGIFIPKESDIFRLNSLVKEIPGNQVLLPVSKASKHEEDSVSAKHAKEVVVESPAKPEIIDPLDEPINNLLKDIEVRNRGSSPTSSHKNNVLQRICRPKYRGDTIFMFLIILSLANLYCVIFF